MIIIASDNGLSPDRRQAIIWTNAGLLSIAPLRTYFSENLIKKQPFSLKKMHVKTSSAQWCPSCLGLNVLNHNKTERYKNVWHSPKIYVSSHLTHVKTKYVIQYAHGFVSILRILLILHFLWIHVIRFALCPRGPFLATMYCFLPFVYLR